MKSINTLIAVLLLSSMTAYTQEQKARYGLKVTAAPKAAQVFVDGRFAGQARPGAPLQIVLDRSSCQLRLTRAGYLDSVHELELKAGKMMHFGVGMRPSREASKWKVPAKPIKIRVGQSVRGYAGKSSKVVYELKETGPFCRLLLGLYSKPKFKVFDDKGNEIKVERMKTRPSGAPGKAFWEFRGAAAGTYRLEVAAGSGHFAFAMPEGLRDLAVTDNPRLKGRRQAPPMPKK